MASEGFKRLVAVASWWKVPPSSYLPTLSGLQRFLVDEAAAHFLAEQTKDGADRGGQWLGEGIL